LDDFSELITALLSDLNVTSSSSLYPTATIKLALNRAYIKCSRLFRWPALQDAKMTSTQANIEYYDAPEDWSPNSIWRLEVDDEQYGEDPDGSPMVFEDYMQWRRNDDNASSTEKKWAVQWLRYFIYPVPTIAGSNNISIWGQKNGDELVEDDDETIFSHNMPECNEAIVMEAREILKLKGEDQKSVANDQMLSSRALGILTVAFNKIKQEASKYEKTQGMFEVPDYFGKGNTTDKIGRF
jgi:hypothetical protein